MSDIPRDMGALVFDRGYHGDAIPKKVLPAALVGWGQLRAKGGAEVKGQAVEQEVGDQTVGHKKLRIPKCSNNTLIVSKIHLGDEKCFC